MNLQEQISRIQEMMDKKHHNDFSDFLHEKFDDVFDRLNLVRTDEVPYQQFDWIDKETGDKIFERNDWGRFWIYGCSKYKDLLIYPKMAGMSYEEFEKTLMTYLNKRYEFYYKPLKDIGDENCDIPYDYLGEQISRIQSIMGLVIESDDFNYTDPNFDMEWEEAKRYIEHPNPSKTIKWTKEEWLEKVKNGKVMKFSEIPNLENITDPSEFEELFPEKVQRFMDALSKKTFELPIAVKLPNGVYDLIAGNTRVTGLRNKHIDPKIWVFEL